MTYKPKCLSGYALTATQWTIQQAGPRRLWNIQSAYNAVCVAGPCHAALSQGRMRGRVAAAADRMERATGAWQTFTATTAYDARRGACLATKLAHPATWTLDALVGTGRAPKPTGEPEVRMLKTVDALGAHFTNSGVLGGVLLGTALGSGLIGAALGCLYGILQGLTAVPFAWITHRQLPWVTLGRSMVRGMQSGASKAVITNLGLFFLQVQALRLGTAGVKLSVAALGTLLGLAVGVLHGAAAACSVAELQPQFTTDQALPTRS